MFRNSFRTHIFSYLLSLFLLTSALAADSQKPDSPSESAPTTVAFTNPALFGIDSGCFNSNINKKRFSDDISLSQEIGFCQDLQRVANQLNGTNWSPELRKELMSIWSVFINENVTIKPMKSDVSNRIVASAEAFVPSGTNGNFSANLYLREGAAQNDEFLLVAMHELRHIYDFYVVWKSQQGISQAELEMRGFRIMSRIARETNAHESFSRLPKLWDDDWVKLPENEIARIVDERIENYMRKSQFYQNLIENPQNYFVGKRTETRSERITSRGNLNVEKVSTKSGRLPYLVRSKNTYVPVKQEVNEIQFEIARATSVENSAELLQAAIKNEKSLYFKMDNFVYDQSLELKCWKKGSVSETLKLSSQMARTTEGEILADNVKQNYEGKEKQGKPSCVQDIAQIKADASDTFWAAPYLDELNVKFDYFTDLDGLRVARYTVEKPNEETIRRLEKKYRHIQPFRIFYGSIFVSVTDAQIVKFWGSTFPESNTTGQLKKGVLASYNATAIREKLTSGLWVTVSLNTVAVANLKGKQKPFSYVVDYRNYRQATSDVVILDDNATVAIAK
ncbi:MAG: hypothetical protein ACK5NT_07905 [Pyrinomonadaceae bacterium]